MKQWQKLHAIFKTTGETILILQAIVKTGDKVVILLNMADNHKITCHIENSRWGNLKITWYSHKIITLILLQIGNKIPNKIYS